MFALMKFMKRIVISQAHNHQICRGIVVPFAINVMDMFRLFQFTANYLLHDMTMFGHDSSVNRPINISVFSSNSDSSRCSNWDRIPKRFPCTTFRTRLTMMLCDKIFSTIDTFSNYMTFPSDAKGFSVPSLVFKTPHSMVDLVFPYIAIDNQMGSSCE